MAVGFGEPFRNGLRDAQRLHYGQRAAAQKVEEVLALNQLHHDERVAFGRLAVVVDARDVRVVEHGGGARFAEEPRAELRVVAGGRGKLDGHAPAEVGVFGNVHHTHAAPAQLAEYAVVGNRAP